MLGEKARDVVFWVGLVAWGTLMLTVAQVLTRSVVTWMVLGVLVLGIGPCPGPPSAPERLHMGFPAGECGTGMVRIQYRGDSGEFVDTSFPIMEPGKDCLAGWPPEDVIGFAKRIRVCCVEDEQDQQRDYCSEAAFAEGQFPQPVLQGGEVVYSDGEWHYMAFGSTCTGRIIGQGGQDLSGG